MTSAPAANTWDVEAITDAARARVLTSPSDDGEARLQRCAVVAVDDVDQFLDRVPPDLDADPPEEAFDAGAVPALFEAAVDRTVDLFLARDDDTTSDADSLERMQARVLSRKSRWSIG